MEDRQKTTTLTDNKKRDNENEGSSMHEDSCIDINYAHTLPKFQVTSLVVGSLSVLHVVNLNFCHCNPLLNFDLNTNSL